MNAVRLVYYVTDPFAGERRPVAALLSGGGRAHLVRWASRDLPRAATANVERILIDVEAAADFDELPIGAGAQTVLGEPHEVPSTVRDPADWVRRAFAS